MQQEILSTCLKESCKTDFSFSNHFQEMISPGLPLVMKYISYVIVARSLFHQLVVWLVRVERKRSIEGKPIKCIASFWRKVIEYCGYKYRCGVKMPGFQHQLVRWQRASHSPLYTFLSPRRCSGKNPPANAGDARYEGLIPGSGRSPGEGHGNPLWYPCLENPMDRGAWWATLHGVTKSWTQLSMCAHTHICYLICQMGMVCIGTTSGLFEDAIA